MVFDASRNAVATRQPAAQVAARYRVRFDAWMYHATNG